MGSKKLANVLKKQADKTIREVYEIYINHFKKNKDDIVKKTCFNDYDQRSYNYNNLEKMLLGQMEYNTDKLLE